MADDRMRHDDDDLQRNMGGGAKDQDYGQQSPGRSGQGGQQGGQQAGGRSGQKGGQNARDMEEDDDLGGKQSGGSMQNRGGHDH